MPSNLTIKGVLKKYLKGFILEGILLVLKVFLILLQKKENEKSALNYFKDLNDNSINVDGM